MRQVAVDEQTRRGALRLILVVVAFLSLAACGSGGGNGGVERAQKHMSDAQKALSDAQSNLAAKTAEFCKSSQTYITALDRYGDILMRPRRRSAT